MITINNVITVIIHYYEQCCYIITTHTIRHRYHYYYDISLLPLFCTTCSAIMSLLLILLDSIITITIISHEQTFHYKQYSYVITTYTKKRHYYYYHYMPLFITINSAFISLLLILYDILIIPFNTVCHCGHYSSLKVGLLFLLLLLLPCYSHQWLSLTPTARLCRAIYILLDVITDIIINSINIAIMS